MQSEVTSVPGWRTSTVGLEGGDGWDGSPTSKQGKKPYDVLSRMKGGKA